MYMYMWIVSLILHAMVGLVSQKFERFPLVIIVLIYKIWIYNYGKSEIIHKDIIMMYWYNKNLDTWRSW